MIPPDVFETCVRRAALAPSVHNTQPARWAQDGDVLTLMCDTDVGLRVGDPTGRDAALSCGAVLEAMILALSAFGYGAQVSYTDAATHPGHGRVPVAHLTVTSGDEDPLNTYLEQRFTWRGSFKTSPPDLFGWTRADMRLVVNPSDRAWIANSNDWASHEIMQNKDFRAELVDWMRLSDSHPRAGLDGMDRASMGMTKGQARAVPIVLLRLWPILKMFKATKSVTSEAEITSTAPLISLFHRDISESPIVSGRAYMRMCLEAASLGFAGWPMAALTDHDGTRDALAAYFNIGPDRQLIQAIRFGCPTGPMPPRARRPLDEVIA